MLRAGADVVRINFSHGEPQAHAQARRDGARGRRAGRQLGRRSRRPAGPEDPHRAFRQGQGQLEEGDAFALDVSIDAKAGNASCRRCRLQESAEGRAGGDTLLLNDGQIVLDVTA